MYQSYYIGIVQSGPTFIKHLWLLKDFEEVRRSYGLSFNDI